MILWFLCFFLGGISFHGVNGRAVNISGAWFLPQEGFPVFYRYFSDKVTWNEAEAVCGFHHADLLSVQTNTQMDAARAYLKEIDVTDNIWIGLRRESPEKAFAWTNGEKLLGDGYWLEPIPKTNEKLCAAIDPVSDFRWNSFYCRGPQVASFICELPVPEWAKKEDGCMITSLPSLTVTLMPEVGVVQLFSDCGLDGTRRIACKGGVNRDEIIRRLSCDVDAFASTVFSKSTTDSTKINTQEGGNLDSNHIEVGQTWETHSPLTRHRRDIDVSSAGTTVSTTQKVTAQTEKETSTQMPTTQGKGDVINIPSHVFPHSPYSAAERNAPGTKPPVKVTPKGIADTVQKIIEAKASPNSTTKITSETPKPSTTPVTLSKAQPPKHGVLNSNDAEETSSLETNKDLPVLIITGEKLNDSLIIKSVTPTSENPQIVFMIDNKDLSEPYVVPLVDDVILNNPSLSPVEVINVDLIDVENITTKGTTAQEAKGSAVPPSEATPPQKPEIKHLLRLKEKTTVNATQPVGNLSKIIQILTTVKAVEIKSATTVPTTKTTKPPVTVWENDKNESVNDMEDERKGDNGELLQRPNRGRLLTHSNHPSFYPYFLNRVLG